VTTPEKDPWIHPDAHPDILAMEQPMQAESVLMTLHTNWLTVVQNWENRIMQSRL
jgi:hypothetical protein